jgi:hypothetical protein
MLAAWARGSLASPDPGQQLCVVHRLDDDDDANDTTDRRRKRTCACGRASVGASCTATSPRDDSGAPAARPCAAAWRRVGRRYSAFTRSSGRRGFIAIVDDGAPRFVWVACASSSVAPAAVFVHPRCVTTEMAVNVSHADRSVARFIKYERQRSAGSGRMPTSLGPFSRSDGARLRCQCNYWSGFPDCSDTLLLGAGA